MNHQVKGFQVHISSSQKWCHYHYHKWHTTTVPIYETLCPVLRLAGGHNATDGSLQKGALITSRRIVCVFSPAHRVKLVAFSLQHPSFSHSPQSRAARPAIGFRSAVWLTGALTITLANVCHDNPLVMQISPPSAICAEGESKDGSTM